MGRFLAELPPPVKVYDGFVELVDVMGDDDEPVDAARVSFDKRAENYTVEQNDRLRRYLLAHHHETPFEMVDFKFRIDAPVVVWWQWVRHRMASYNFVSGRYVPLDETRVYAPTEWRMQSKDNKQGSDPNAKLDPVLSSIFSQRRDVIYEQAFKLYKDMLDAGIAKEQARLVLPFAACYYTAIWKVNGRSLMNFITLRRDGHAQEEIRSYASALLDLVVITHPKIFGDAWKAS